jgi:antirestriction protein ArdC
VPTKLTDEQRQARREADRERAADAVEALKSSEGWQAWLALRRHFRTYSPHNQFLIALQCREATRVAGFRRWLDLGYAVRRGQHGIWIWMPVSPTKKELTEWEAAGADPEQRPRTRFRMGPVFDRSQVDPLPAPAQPVDLDPPIVPLEGDELCWAVDPLIALARDEDWKVVFEPSRSGADGTCIPDLKILTINNESTSSVNKRVLALAHELSHMLIIGMRQAACEPRFEDEHGELTLRYSEEELVVESIAFTVCGSLGVDTTNDSIPYLASWSERASMETIERCASLIDRVTKRIEDAVIPTETSKS